MADAPTNNEQPLSTEEKESAIIAAAAQFRQKAGNEALNIMRQAIPKVDATVAEKEQEIIESVGGRFKTRVEYDHTLEARLGKDDNIPEIKQAARDALIEADYQAMRHADPKSPKDPITGRTQQEKIDVMISYDAALEHGGEPKDYLVPILQARKEDKLKEGEFTITGGEHIARKEATGSDAVQPPATKDTPKTKTQINH